MSFSYAEYYAKNKNAILLRVKKYRKNNAEKVKEWSATYRTKHKDKLREYDRRWKQENRPLFRTRKRGEHLKAAYGITAKQYDYMFSAQGGKCQICERELKLVVDHCHETKAIRGLLCNGCNSGLGYFRENTNALANAIRYISSFTHGGVS